MFGCMVTDELGTLEPGKFADVIIVDGHPRKGIEAMNRVIGVIKNDEVVSELCQDATASLSGQETCHSEPERSVGEESRCLLRDEILRWRSG